MSTPIVGKIDVTKIDKARLFKGAKGTWLDVFLVPCQGQFGDDFMVVQQVTKEERLAGKRGAILGNAKFLGAKPQGQNNQPHTSSVPPSASSDGADSDVPF